MIANYSHVLGLPALSSLLLINTCPGLAEIMAPMSLDKVKL
jgi:hypothetical protein